MDHLWAPWRLSYVATAKAPATDDPCFICRGLADGADRANLIALRTPLITSPVLDARTGAEIWQQVVRLTPLSNTTGTPVLYRDRVYVPISASEITVGADERHLLLKVRSTAC